MRPFFRVDVSRLLTARRPRRRDSTPQEEGAAAVCERLSGGVRSRCCVGPALPVLRGSSFRPGTAAPSPPAPRRPLPNHSLPGLRRERAGKQLGGREGTRARPANDGVQEKCRQELPAQDEGRQVSGAPPGPYACSSRTLPPNGSGFWPCFFMYREAACGRALSADPFCGCLGFGPAAVVCASAVM